MAMYEVEIKVEKIDELPSFREAVKFLLTEAKVHFETRAMSLSELGENCCLVRNGPSGLRLSMNFFQTIMLGYKTGVIVQGRTILAEDAPEPPDEVLVEEFLHAATDRLFSMRA